MKLIQLLNLQPTEQQKEILLATMEQFNSACNYVSKIAFAEHTASHVKLHRLAYYAIREEFGLPSQMAVRVISKVAEAYKANKKQLHVFEPYDIVVYDWYTLSFKSADRISLATIRNRQVIPFVFIDYRLLKRRRARMVADLIYRGNCFGLAVCVDVPELPTLPLACFDEDNLILSRVM